MTDPSPITREDAASYLRFLRGLGWTHVGNPHGQARASQREGSVSASQPAPESTPPPSPRRPLAPAHDSDLFAPEPLPLLPRPERVARLAAREEELQTCRRCKLCCTQNRAAHRLVYGVGSPEAEIAFVGEGPGEEEDNQGIPFVGRAGELLTRIIQAMGLERGDVYICNVVKHRPPGNRNPEPDEIAACEPFLLEQLDIIRPRVMVTLGNVATQTLLRTKTGITRLRGTWQTYHGIPAMPTYHPAFLLRSYTRANREAVWSDMKAVLAKLAELRGDAPCPS